MNVELIYIFGSVLLVSLISVIAVIPLFYKKEISKKLLVALLSLSVGSLLGAVFIHFLPESIEEHGYTLKVALYILSGFLTFFVLERLIHFHHGNECSGKESGGHSHGYHLSIINLVGDGIHNFLDGMVIAVAYLVNIPLGLAATVSIIIHEIPQEIADFGVLLYSGLHRNKALLFNLLSALTSVVGAILAVVLSTKIEWFHSFIIPFAAGNFLYIAASNLLPELHRHCGIKDTLIHITAICFGIGFMVLFVIFFPAQTH